MVLLSNCASQHVTLYRFHQIQVNLISYRFLIDNWVANWRIIQSRCDRHARQLYDSVVGNSGNIFFATCFRQFMIFCAKFYFSAQMATMAIGNANPASHPRWFVQSFSPKAFLVLEEKNFKGFYHIWAWRPFWSMDSNNFSNLLFPYPKVAPHEIWAKLTQRLQRRSCLKF